MDWQFAKISRFLNVFPSSIVQFLKKQYHISKSELYQKAVIYRGHPHAILIVQFSESKNLICCGLRKLLS